LHATFSKVSCPDWGTKTDEKDAAVESNHSQVKSLSSDDHRLDN
jgi:hypothetical protein